MCSKPFKQSSNSRSHQAYSQAYCCKDTGKLGDVERRLHLWFRTISRNFSVVDLRIGISHHLGVFLGGTFVNHVFNRLCHLAVRRPERLTNADRIVDNLGNRGVPTKTVIIIKYGMFANHNISNVAIGHDSGDVQCAWLALAGAVAIKDVHVAQRCHRALCAHIGNLDTEVTSTLIDVQCSSLEDSSLRR